MDLTDFLSFLIELFLTIFLWPLRIFNYLPYYLW